MLSDEIYSASYEQFLARLRQARRQAGLSQVEVARLLGKPQSFVSKCESGERRVDFVELLAFKDIYQVDLNFSRLSRREVALDVDRLATTRAERSSLTAPHTLGRSQLPSVFADDVNVAVQERLSGDWI